LFDQTWPRCRKAKAPAKAKGRNRMDILLNNYRKEKIKKITVCRQNDGKKEWIAGLIVYTID